MRRRAERAAPRARSAASPAAPSPPRAPSPLPRARTEVPSRKPFLNLLGRVFKWRMRPVPSVRLRSALCAQLYFRMPARG